MVVVEVVVPSILNFRCQGTLPVEIKEIGTALVNLSYPGRYKIQ